MGQWRRQPVKTEQACFGLRTNADTTRKGCITAYPRGVAAEREDAEGQIVDGEGLVLIGTRYPRHFECSCSEKMSMS